MKKFLSIVISILMISAMISVVALADGATISLSAVTGLVAGEKVSLTPTVYGAATYTVEVNNQVFGITDGTASGSITSKTVNAGDPFELVVNNSIPQTFTSKIRLTAGETQIKVDVSVADRKLGDANGDGTVDVDDANDVLLYYASLTPSANFKAIASNADGIGEVDVDDANQILLYYASLSYSNANLGVLLGGNNTALDIVDPFASVATPLANVTGLSAYYYNGNLYYEFTAAANASGYTIQVGSAAPVAINTTSGHVAASWDGTGTLAVKVVSKGDGTTYTDSTGITENAVFANVSGDLSSWLTTNSLTGVAVTVYEIPAVN